MAKLRDVPGIRKYDGPAGSWGALKATATAIRLQMDTVKAAITLLRTAGYGPSGSTGRAGP
ncbi:hypothetical protein ACIP1U_24935 [Cupriavidus sp. NPDC089707]|uniref:hypothetical protein n=1 Tax=Cupriavidus sp. NPDC089707 TaxID=3363963 RepID=UPI0038247851